MYPPAMKPLLQFMGLVDENGRWIPEQERQERYKRKMAQLKEEEQQIHQRMMNLADENAIQ